MVNSCRIAHQTVNQKLDDEAEGPGDRLGADGLVTCKRLCSLVAHERPADIAPTSVVVFGNKSFWGNYGSRTTKAS